METQIIGVVGGMGSFATLDFFRRILLAFPATKEWERPRVIIDNNCTMPSRVRAILYNEKYQEVVEELTKSISILLSGGATDIVLACNTSHYFLKDILRDHPEWQGKIVNIIEATCQEIHRQGIKNPYLIATEGTIDTNIYPNALKKFGNEKILLPTAEEQILIREFIEAVKQNLVDSKIKEKFREYLNAINSDCVILGCTEIPIIYREAYLREGLHTKKLIIDPLEMALEQLTTRGKR